MRQLLSGYLEQALSADRSAAVEAHLHECDECWHQFQTLGEMDLTLALDDPELREMVVNEPPPLPDDFTAQVMNRVEEERPQGVNLVWPWLRRRWSRHQYASAAYAMSATVVVVSASSVLSLWTESTEQLTVWGVQAEAYWDTFLAYIGGAGSGLELLWHQLLTWLQLG